MKKCIIFFFLLNHLSKEKKMSRFSLTFEEKMLMI